MRNNCSLPFLPNLPFFPAHLIHHFSITSTHPFCPRPRADEALGIERAPRPARELDEQLRLLAAGAKARQQQMVVPIHRQEPFTSTNGAISAVQKNTSYARAGCQDYMIGDMRSREETFYALQAERDEIIAAEEERIARLGSEVVVEEEVEEELAYGELLEMDDDDEEEFL